ncbi:hypothetical protein QFZ74_002216 [Streptomyces sp. V3I7]|nr:hypothetical protein [Streptomyces sp. V3I7]
MLGLVAYSAVACVGVSLLAGARFTGWYWLGLEAGCLFGVGFVTWLPFESLYRIGALCLWCCLAWAATILMFWYVASSVVRNRFLPAPRRAVSFLDEFTWVLPLLHLAVVGVLILTRGGTSGRADYCRVRGNPALVSFPGSLVGTEDASPVPRKGPDLT